jgi:Kef-type K+ transport system membrane component KefB
VPVAKKLGLGSVLGYLLAGILIGPFGLGFVGSESEDIMHGSEFGVVMMLFLIGLELPPQSFWQMRKAIAGLGLFFTAVGSTINFELIAHEAGLIFGLVGMVMAVKTGVLALIGKKAGFRIEQNALFFGAVLSGGRICVRARFSSLARKLIGQTHRRSADGRHAHHHVAFALVDICQQEMAIASHRN